MEFEVHWKCEDAEADVGPVKIAIKSTTHTIWFGTDVWVRCEWARFLADALGAEFVEA